MRLLRIADEAAIAGDVARDVDVGAARHDPSDILRRTPASQPGKGYPPARGVYGDRSTSTDIPSMSPYHNPSPCPRDKACPSVVLALRNLHAVDEEMSFCPPTAASLPSYSYLPNSRFSEPDASRMAHSATSVGPVNDRAGDQTTDEKPLATHGQTVQSATLQHLTWRS